MALSTGVGAEMQRPLATVATLRDKVVPAMEQAYEAIHAGYREGKFGMLDLLDAQQKLFAALVDALTEYHLAQTDLRRITGDLDGTAFRH